MNDETASNNDTRINPVEYQPPLEAMKLASMPRFGHGRDMSVLFSGDREAATDYMVGLIFAGAFIVAMFVTWSVLLLVFMCCQQKRVGWLSGRPFIVKKPAPPAAAGSGAEGEEHVLNGDDDNLVQGKGTTTTTSGFSESATNNNNNNIDDENENESQRPTGGGEQEQLIMGGSAEQTQDESTTKANVPAAAEAPGWSEYASEENKAAAAAAPVQSFPVPGQSSSSDSNYKDDYSKDCCCGYCGAATLCRILFLLSGAAFVICAILLVTEGVANLEQTVQSVGYSAGKIADIAGSIEDIYAATFGQNQTENAINDRNELEDELGNRTAFCPADPDLSFDRDLSDLLADTDVKLEQLGNMLQAETASLNTTAVTVRIAAEQVSETLTTNVPDWVAPVIIVPCVIIVGSLMLAASLGLCGIPIPCVMLCVLNWMVVPFFILLVTVSVAVAAAITIASGINSDFCLPGGYVTASPDDSIKNIMIASGIDNTSDTYHMVSYFVDQCEYLDNTLLPVQDFIPAAEQAATFLQEVNDTLGNATYVTDLVTKCARQFDAVNAAVRAFTGILSTLTAAVIALVELLKCEIVVRLYTNTVYNAVCRYSVIGVYWIFATTLAMGAFGMAMLTTRSSYKSDYVQYVPVPGGGDSGGGGGGVVVSSSASTRENNNNNNNKEENDVVNVAEHEGAGSSSFQDENSKPAAAEEAADADDALKI